MKPITLTLTTTILLTLTAHITQDIRIWLLAAVLLLVCIRMYPAARRDLDAAEERRRQREEQMMADAADRDDFAVQLNRERMFREYVRA